MALTVTSLRGPLAAFCDYIGAQSWPVLRHEAHVLEIFPEELHKMVMLTPDAQEALEGPLERDAIYIIGGIVDKSVVKGLSHGWAEAAGVRARRLPVREMAGEVGMDFHGANKTPVLAVSDVVVALIEAGRNGGDWAAALRVAVPERVRRGGRRQG